jgi:hypothetical protein
MENVTAMIAVTKQKAFNKQTNQYLLVMAGIFIIYVAILVLFIASNWAIYTKAGQPGWASIVPIYNLLVQADIVGISRWSVLLALIPIVNIVFLIYLMHLLAKSFGKEMGFTMGLIFLPFIFLPMLAFGDATYEGPAGQQA